MTGRVEFVAEGWATRARRALAWLVRELVRPRGTRAWDAVAHGSGAIGLLAMPLLLVLPAAAPLVALALITIALHGPISFVFQGAFEPILMWFGSQYSPVLVAVIATAGNLYIECVNYALFRGALRLRAVGTLLTKPHASRALRRVERTRLWASCQRRPFWMVLLCTASPIPDTIGRVAAVANDYPMRPYLLAHFFGRFPRFLFWAWLGSFLPVDPRWFALATKVSVGAGLLVLAVLWLRRRAPRRKHHAPRNSGPTSQRAAA